MGHHINHYTQKYKSDKQAKEFIATVTASAYDPNETDSYHGNMNCHFKHVYADYDEAMQAIHEYDTGWYSDHAVLYHRPTDSARILAEAWNQKRDEFINSHSVHKRKSAFLGCENCGSKISRTYLKGEKCPVCGYDLRPASTIEKIKMYDKKAKEALKKGMETWILVKVEYHC